MQVLQIAPFRNYLIANTIFIYGMQMQGLLVGWHLYQLTGDAFALGLSGLAEAVPYMLCALIGGYYADRLHRKRLILWSVSGYLACALAFYAITVSHISDEYRTSMLYAIIVATGICRGFLSPSKSALMAQIIPKHLYLQGSTWYSILWQAAALAGPAAGGLLLAYMGLACTYAIVAACALMGLIFFAMVNGGQVQPSVTGNSNFLPGLKLGFQFVWRHPLLLPAFGLDMIAVLFGGAVALLPIFNQEILHSGAQGLGLLRMAPAAGAVAMGLALTRISIKHHTGWIFFASVLVFGICILVFALSTHFWISWLALFCSGAADNISVVVRSTIFQMFTPDDMRGRVSAINSLFISTSNELGAFESGLAAKVLGLVPSVIFGASITIAITLAVGVLAPKLRQLSIYE